MSKTKGAGTLVAHAAPGKPKRKWTRWTQPMKDAFLDHLAATCNVRAAAAAIDVTPPSIYHLRRKDAEFAAQWADAAERGYELLELQLIGHALAGGGAAITNGATELTGPLDAELALKLLTHYRNRREGKQGPDGPKPKIVSAEQTDLSILRKLKAMGVPGARELPETPMLPPAGDR